MTNEEAIQVLQTDSCSDCTWGGVISPVECDCPECPVKDAIDLAISALERDRWISVEERLPEEPYGCLLIVWDSNPMGGDDFLNYLPYFAGWDGEQWNDGDGMQVPFEVVYWKPLLPLPEPPKEET